MRIAVLCNDRIALPAIDQLLAARLLVAAGMPDRINEAQMLMKARCAHYKVPLQLFSKPDLKGQLNTWLDQHKPDVVLVKTFPFRIPGDVITKPKHGFVNFHYAPLPQWRGPNPLFWMIRNQVMNGGVTVHRMNADFDAGPVLLQQAVQRTPDTNYGLYYSQLAFSACNLMGALLNGLQQGNLQEKEQDHSQAKWYGRPQPSDLMINWATMSADEIKALVKACNPWNKGAGTRWKGWTFGITDASVADNEDAASALPGTILSIDPNNGGLMIATIDKKAIKAEVVYCEEGFFPGHSLGTFGLRKHEQLV